MSASEIGIKHRAQEHYYYLKCSKENILEPYSFYGQSSLFNIMNILCRFFWQEKTFTILLNTSFGLFLVIKFFKVTYSYTNLYLEEEQIINKYGIKNVLVYIN